MVHFLPKMDLRRPADPSSKVYLFPPSSDSSLPESLRVLTEIHLQLLGKPELSGIKVSVLLARAGKLGNVLQSN